MSDTRFTATTGWYVEKGCIYSPDGLLWGTAASGPGGVLIEYGAHQAQADRDAELGRWRSVEHPDFVAYDHGDGRIRFLRELDGVSYSFARDYMSIRYPAECAEFPFLVVAREFFEAHPEPKPWEQAKDGEVWALTVGCGDAVVGAVLGKGGWAWLNAKTGLVIDLPITAGQRIWPEVSA